MHVTMNSATNHPTSAPIYGIDGETAIEIERLRLYWDSQGDVVIVHHHTDAGLPLF